MEKDPRGGFLAGWLEAKPPQRVKEIKRCRGHHPSGIFQTNHRDVGKEFSKPRQSQIPSHSCYIT